MAFARPLLTALADGNLWKTQDLAHEAVQLADLTDAQRTEVLPSGVERADNRARFALHYLRRANAVEAVSHGVSRITSYGRELLDSDQEITLGVLRERPEYQAYKPKDRRGSAVTESDDLPAFWFVSARFRTEDGKREDHTPEFVESGTWRTDDPAAHSEAIKSMQRGERIAIKSWLTRKYNLPFDANGHTASALRIRATGTIADNPGDGESVSVNWDPPETLPQVDWYFWTSRSGVWKVKEDRWTASALIAFTFKGAGQDYDAFLKLPYWAEKYFGTNSISTDDPDDLELDLEDEDEEDTQVDAVTYTVDDIIEKGSFASADELNGYLDALRRKKNLILQGPPGTGKTWLAKRLAYALIGREDRSLIHAVQFHPTVSYEDFVRGWRPGGDGRLTLTDGLFLEVIEAAKNEPDTTHVLVIEEINRANLAQVMGELLTLLEADKRKGSEALRLAYPRSRDELVFIPENLYVIGTMNLADRSLAIVDFALRRRFAFADLAPQFNAAWRAWVSKRNGIDDTFLRDLAYRIDGLNRAIAGERSLGSQYRIGHSFFTPANPTAIDDPQAWLADIVEQEIHPLLSDYWFDDPERVEKETAALLGLP